MAAMNPILRLRQAFRSLGVESAEADEVADAVDDHSYSRRESDLRFERMMAEMRREMADMRRQMLIEIIVIFGVAVGILALVN